MPYDPGLDQRLDELLEDLADDYDLLIIDTDESGIRSVDNLNAYSSKMTTEMGGGALTKKKMFGGIGWMLNGNMCIGIYKDQLIARVGDSKAKELLQRPHVKPMDITGTPMKGWVMVLAEGIESDKDLRHFMLDALKFVATLEEK